MKPEDAIDALSPLSIACNDWTPDKFALWASLVASEADDPELAYQASARVVRNLTTTFVPAFTVWAQAYRDLRNEQRRRHGWNQIGSGRGISLAEHLAHLQDRTDPDSRAELVRWSAFAARFPRTDLFGTTWRTVLNADRQEPAA